MAHYGIPPTLQSKTSPVLRLRYLSVAERKLNQYSEDDKLVIFISVYDSNNYLRLFQDSKVMYYICFYFSYIRTNTTML